MPDVALPKSPDWGCAALDVYRALAVFSEGVDVAALAHRVRGRLVYLATPYSKVVVNPEGYWCASKSWDAALAANTWVVRFACVGVTAISPVVLTDAIADSYEGDEAPDPLDHEFWMQWCAPLLAKCDAVVVPPIEGWSDSDGIWAEACAALTTNRPVFLLAGDNAGGGV